MPNGELKWDIKNNVLGITKGLTQNTTIVRNDFQLGIALSSLLYSPWRGGEIKMTAIRNIGVNALLPANSVAST